MVLPDSESIFSEAPMAASTLKCLQQLCTSFYFHPITSADSLKLLMNTQEHLHTCWTFTVLSRSNNWLGSITKIGKKKQLKI